MRFFGGGARTHSLVMAYQTKQVRFVDTVHMFDRDGRPACGSSVAEVADPGAAAPVDLEVILTPGLGNATYLLGVGGDAVVVDPPRDAWRLEPILRRRDWRLRYVVETHVHNDYLSGALECVAAHKATVVAPARGGYAFAHRGVEAGDEVALDGLRLVARATPGHTPEHLAWDVIPDGALDPTAILTGGSLLVGSAGRTDLLGPERTDELTAAQFRSLRSLAALPGATGIWPTTGPAASAPPARPTVDGPRPSTPNGSPTPCCASPTRRRSVTRSCPAGYLPRLLRVDGADQPCRPADPGRRAAAGCPHAGDGPRSRRGRGLCHRWPATPGLGVRAHPGLDRDRAG